MLIGLVELVSVHSMLYTRFQSSLTHIQASPSPKQAWGGPTNLVVIIVMADVFIASRSVDIQV